MEARQSQDPQGLGYIMTSYKAPPATPLKDHCNTHGVKWCSPAARR